MLTMLNAESPTHPVYAGSYASLDWGFLKQNYCLMINFCGSNQARLT